MNDAKVCNKCGEVKPLDQFSPAKRMADGRHGTCRACRAERARRHLKENPAARERQREYQRNHPESQRAAERRYQEANREKITMRLAGKRQAARDVVFDHYGRACACCGSTENLSIDHVNGDGDAHRTRLRIYTGSDTYRWLIKNGFPEGFQTLCLPCNASKKCGQQCRLDHQAAEAA